jgi:hypothetical protein
MERFDKLPKLDGSTGVKPSQSGPQTATQVLGGLSVRSYFFVTPIYSDDQVQVAIEMAEQIKAKHPECECYVVSTFLAGSSSQHDPDTFLNGFGIGEESEEDEQEIHGIADLTGVTDDDVIYIIGDGEEPSKLANLGKDKFVEKTLGAKMQAFGTSAVEFQEVLQGFQGTSVRLFGQGNSSDVTITPDQLAQFLAVDLNLANGNKSTRCTIKLWLCYGAFLPSSFAYAFFAILRGVQKFDNVKGYSYKSALRNSPDGRAASFKYGDPDEGGQDEVIGKAKNFRVQILDEGKFWWILPT